MQGPSFKFQVIVKFQVRRPVLNGNFDFRFEISSLIIAFGP